MEFTVSALIHCAHTFTGAAASMAGSLSLLRFEPFRRPYVLCGMVIVFGTALVLQRFLPLPVILWIPLLLAYMVVIHLFFHANHIYACLAALLWMLFWGLHRLLFSLFPSSFSHYLMTGIDLIALIISGLSSHYQVALLPDSSYLPSVGDTIQRKKFRFTLFYVVLSLTIMNFGVIFALSAWDSFSGWLRPALVVLIFVISFLILGYIRLLTFSMAGQIEALVDKQYQNDLLNFMQVIRSQRHDFNFHMRTLSGLIHQKQYSACDEYIEEMLQNTTDMNDILPLHHPAISAMINAFWEIAKQKGIDFNVNISSDLAQLPCTIYETNTIIGNLLQNAIDELEQSGASGPICLLILFRSGTYIIRVSNPCSKSPEEFQSIFRPGYTTKQSHEGIGLTTVRRIVTRHDGNVFPEFENGTISLIVQIPFRV